MTPVGYEKTMWESACAVEAAIFADHHDAGRVSRALALAQQGAVTLAPARDASLLAEVRSGRTVYEITHGLTCGCKDFDTARAEACKHILAALITRKAMDALAPEREPGEEEAFFEGEAYVEELAKAMEEDEYDREYVVSSEGKPQEQPSETPSENAQGCVGDLSILDVPAQTQTPPPASQAGANVQGCVGDSRPQVVYQVDNPAGFNFKARVGSTELWYTFHDVDDEHLLARLKIVLPQLQTLVEAYEVRSKNGPVAPISGNGTLPASSNNGTRPRPPIDGNDTDRSWCPHHQVQMDWHPENERGPGWYSHRLGSGGYCRGGN